MGIVLWILAAQSLAAPCTPPANLQARLNAHPGTIEAANLYQEVGASFQKQGQVECAIESYRAALRLTPRSRTTLHSLAQLLAAKHDFSSIVGLLRSASLDEELTLDLATAYERTGSPVKASETLVAGLRSMPSSSRIASDLVVLTAGQGQLDEAYRLARNYYRLHPQDPGAQKLYLRVLVATGQADAPPLARKMLAASPEDGELLYLNGVIERKSGDFVAARDHLQRSIAKTPDYSQSRLELGMTLARLHDEAGARDQLEKAIALGAKEPEAHLELSKALRTLDQPAQADQELKLYQRSIQAKADHEMAAGKGAEASRELDHGDAQKAVQLYQEAVEAEPGQARWQYSLALALDKTGDKSAERKALERAVQLDPRLSLAQHQLGYLVYQSGDYEIAEEHFRAAVSADPDFTQAWVSLAATLATESHFAEARGAVEHALLLDPHHAEALQIKKELAKAK